MKKILLALFVLSSFVLQAQPPVDYVQMNNYAYKYLKADSGFRIPRRDTLLYRNGTAIGLLTIRPQDSSLYIWNGAYWPKIQLGPANTNNKVDSVTLTSTTIYYWINGVSYGTNFPALGSLQNVTDIGYSTSDSLITGNGFYVEDIGTEDPVASLYQDATVGRLKLYSLVSSGFVDISPDSIYYVNSSGGKLSVKNDSVLTGYISLQQPSRSGQYSLTSDLTGFIPITGTTTGNPVTGDIKISNSTTGPVFMYSGDIAGGTSQGFHIDEDDGTFYWFKKDMVTESTVQLSLEDMSVSFPASARGIVGNADYSANYDDLTYVQKKYVDSIASISGPTPNLQQVTDANYITNNPLVVTNSIGDFVSSLLTFSGDGLLDISKADGTKTVNVTPTTIDFNDNISGFASTIDGFSNAATQNNDIEMPNASGTIALSVNNKPTDGLGNVNIDAIDVGVKVVQPVGTATYVVPVGTLVETILIQEPTNITVDVGTTPGGNDLIAGWNITGGASSLGLNYYSTSSSTIYVTGLTGSSQLKIYKR